jgi:hypothetical protein
MRVNEGLPALARLKKVVSFALIGSAGNRRVAHEAWEHQGMKSRENLVRLKQFQVTDKRRRLGQLDGMIAEFDRMASELDAQIATEEKKAGITDVNHFAYPTFAKAARARRDNLKNSRADLLTQRSLAQALLGEAEAELSKAEALDARDRREGEGQRAALA